VDVVEVFQQQLLDIGRIVTHLPRKHSDKIPLQRKPNRDGTNHRRMSNHDSKISGFFDQLFRSHDLSH
jgi:hypothetical protein